MHVLRRACSLGAVALALGGCALFAKPTDDVRISRGAFALVYADVAAAYAAIAPRVVAACRARQLDAETCRAAQRASDRLQEIDRQARKLIVAPAGVEPDWEAITTALRLVIGLAGML